MKLLILFVFCILEIAYSANVGFYQDANYTTLLTEGSSDSDPNTCFNLPEQSHNLTTSIKAEDACIILFDQVNCTGFSIIIRKDVANLADLVGSGTNDNFDDKTISYRFCGNGEGNVDFINVDFYDGENYHNYTTSYNDVCRCVSLPFTALLNVTSIDNHHNCIEIFTTDNCQDDPNALVLYGGKSSQSGDLTKSPIYSKMQSFIPCQIPRRCVKLDSTIYHLEITDASDEDIDAQSETHELSMAAKTKVWNNGTAKVTQEYTASRYVRETVYIHTERWSKNDEWSSNPPTEQITVGVKSLSVSLSSNVVAGLKEMYSKPEDPSEEDGFPTETSTKFTAKQTIQVPACTYYEVESFVKVVDNFPVLYNTYSKFRGETAGEMMTAEELKKAVEATGKFTYHEKVDDYTVSAYTRSNITASFGIETHVVGSGGKIPYCYA